MSQFELCNCEVGEENCALSNSDYLKQIDVICNQLGNTLLEAKTDCKHLKFAINSKKNFWLDKLT